MAVLQSRLNSIGRGKTQSGRNSTRRSLGCQVIALNEFRTINFPKGTRYGFIRINLTLVFDWMRLWPRELEMCNWNDSPRDPSWFARFLSRWLKLPPSLREADIVLAATQLAPTHGTPDSISRDLLNTRLCTGLQNLIEAIVVTAVTTFTLLPWPEKARCRAAY